MIQASAPNGTLPLAVRLGLLGFGAFFGLFLMEIALRVTGISYPDFYIPDPYRGAAMRPLEEGWYRGEGKQFVRVSSAGLRDREHELAKPPGTFRIAVLGDSYAEAKMVPMEKTFWSLLERGLQGCPAFQGQTVEAINFGVSGYGTAQQLLTLRHRVWPYSPDLVLLALFTGNDIRNNHRALERDPGIPYFLLKDGELILDDSFRQTSPAGFRNDSTPSLRTRLRRNLRTLQVVGEARRKWRAGPFRTPPPLAPGEEEGVDRAVFSPPTDPAWQEAWAVTEALIRQMRSEVEARGARFRLATLSAGIQVHPDLRFREEFHRRLGIDSLFYPDRRLAALAARENIPLTSLAEPLAAYAERHNAFLHGSPDTPPGTGHWNESGHALAARILIAEICAQGPHPSGAMHSASRRAVAPGLAMEQPASGVKSPTE
jgi:hypothetical protein